MSMLHEQKKVLENQREELKTMDTSSITVGYEKYLDKQIAAIDKEIAKGPSEISAASVGVAPLGTMANPPAGAVPTGLTMWPDSPINRRYENTWGGGGFNVPTRQPQEFPTLNFGTEGQIRSGTGGAWVSANFIFTGGPSITWMGPIQGAVNGAGQWQARMRYIWAFNVGAWSPWSAWFNFTTSTFPPSATGLLPFGQQNRNEPITLSWTFQPHTNFPDDPQLSSQVEFWQGSGARTLVAVPGTVNQHTIPASTFPTEAAVNFRVRVQGGDEAGWGEWSRQASFTLTTINPPAAPTNLRPTTPQNRTRAIELSWMHNAGAGAHDPQDGAEVEFWQGNGARTLLEVAWGNRLTLFADTFTTNADASFRARTHGQRGGWGAWSAAQAFGLTLDPPLAPTNLQPTETQHRRLPITLSWRHSANPNDWDSQTDSQVEVWQGTGERLVIHGGTLNRAEAPADTFTTDETVTFRARTQTMRNGWGDWSGAASFGLSVFPSLAPTNLQPTEVRNPRMDIHLSWRFNRSERWTPNDEQTGARVEAWQGTGARMPLEGDSGNRAVLPANTFTATESVSFRVRTLTNLGGEGEWSAAASIPLRIDPPHAPTDMQPTNLSPATARNPRGGIRASWLFVPNPHAPDDIQTDSEARFRQGGGAWRTVNGGAGNRAELPPGFFRTHERVEFQARTRTEINGWGDWSGTASFELRETPPHAPTLLFPVGRPTLAANGAFLEWGYNSPYDIFPSRFDVRYRIGGGGWVYLRTDSAGGLPAGTNARTRPVAEQSRAEWQARAWGEMGDAGPWSETAQFMVIGTPPTPEIVRVTDSGRPDVHFSSRNALSWELEILHRGETLYATGQKPFAGEHIYTVTGFIPNGSHLARLRIANEFGIHSEWAELAFSVNVEPPEALSLTASNNLQYRTRLWFDGRGRSVFVYRSETDSPSNGFMCIARVDDMESYEDYTVRPRRRYSYFVRVVGAGHGFADSNVETAKSDFPETTIAGADSPHDMVLLLTRQGSRPTKNSSFESEKTLAHFAGRRKPVLQAGGHTMRSLSLAFHVALCDRDRLENLSESGGILILRDWRLGVLYGTITGGISATGDGIGEHCGVSFNFTETDHAAGAAPP